MAAARALSETVWQKHRFKAGAKLSTNRPDQGPERFAAKRARAAVRPSDAQDAHVGGTATDPFAELSKARVDPPACDIEVSPLTGPARGVDSRFASEGVDRHSGIVCNRHASGRLCGCDGFELCVGFEGRSRFLGLGELEVLRRDQPNRELGEQVLQLPGFAGVVRREDPIVGEAGHYFERSKGKRGGEVSVKLGYGLRRSSCF